MTKIRYKSASISENPQLNAPKFHFSQYQVGTAYNNNDEIIDFVTDGNSLYVCQVNTVIASHENIADQEGFLKLVSQGPQGIRGPRGEDGDSAVTPRIDVNFDDDQLRVKVNGETKALSPSLTGPSWKPVLEDNILTWELTDDRYMPESIDLMNLRPIQERPLLLRTNSDNTKRSDESSGPANFIQWKYEGDEYWTNLISISELMNLTLAGVSIWQNSEGKWHFGHKEVVKATYASDKNGRKIISNVKLGDILFDAGELPFAESDGGNDYGTDIDLIWQKLAELEAAMVKSVNNVGPDPVTGNVNVDCGTPVDTSDCVKSVTINGTTKTPVDGNVSFTINVGETSLFDVRFDNSTHKLQKTTDGQTWIDLVDLDDYTGGTGGGLTEAQVKALIGKILEGLDAYIPDEYVRGNDHNYFIRLSDLANYTTADDVAAMIRDAMTGQNVDYYRVFTLYQRTNSPTTAPAKPVVGVWEWNTAANVDAIALKPNNSSAWSNHPENATTSTPYLWMTSATYSYLTKSEVGQDPWETPICLTAEPGEDGADGDSVEFIYILCTDAEFNNIKNTTPVAEHGDNRPDDLPVYTTPSGNGWTDHPSGISETYQIEAVSIRTKDNGTWSSYSNPTIWSMWGEDGIDGDGVEYIFAVAAENETAVDPQTGKRELNASFFRGQTATQILPLTDQEVTTLGASYQISDWCPDGTTKQGYLMPDLNWTDNPSDVGPDQPYEFVAIRKKKLDPVSGQMKWGPFSTPALWGFWGQKTVTVIENGNVYRHPYTCFAFTRSATDITGYTVVNPWTYNNITYAAWIAADNTREVGYYSNPLSYVVTLDDNNQVVSSANLTWSDTIPAPPGQLYMITNHIGDEASGNDQGWTSPRAWGDASGFQVEYANSSTATDNVYNRVAGYTLPKLDNYDLDNNPNLNDPDGDGIDEAAWRNYVENTLHLGEWGDEDDITDPDYMATCYKKQEGVWSAWQISRIKGEKGDDSDIPGPAGKDGTDIEFVYFRTDAEGHRPGMSPTYGTYNGQTKVSEDLYKDDFLPMATANGFTLDDNELKIGNDFFWHDHPAGVTENLPCEWVGMRHTSYDLQGDKLWGNFNIALWSKYGANGRDGDGIEYVFWDLTEEQASSVSGDVLPTRLSDTNYTDNHNPARHIYESECLPSITLTVNGSNVSLIAKDDNPGVTDQKPYVYASMRKWKYDSTAGEHKWGEFSPIKLWLIKPEDLSSNGILDIKNSVTAVKIDTNGRLEKLTFDPSSNVELRNSRVLMNIDSIEIEGSNGDIISATYNYDNETATYDKTQTVVITNEDNVSATVNIYSAGCKEDRRCSISLHVVFSQVGGQNPQLSKPFIIPITGINNTLGIAIEGTDFFRLSPTTEDTKLSLDTTYGLTKIWTTSKGSGDYKTNSSTWPIAANGVGSSLLKNTQVKYFFKFDDQVNYMTFALPVATLNSNGRYQVVCNGTTIIDGNGRQSFTFYFDKNGNFVNNQTDAFFWIHLGNPDVWDNADPWTVWASYAGVYFNKFYTSHVDGQNDYPIDEIVIGVGTNESVTPIDYEPIPILYDGKNGRRGTSVEIVGIVESSSDSIVVNPTSDQSSSNNEVEDGEEENSGGTRRAPTRGGEQTEVPEIEIDENGQITVVDNEDGTITISDDSGDYSVLNIANGSVNKFQILKITQYDENDNASVTYEAKKIQTVESIPSWYLIKDAFYYSAGSDDPLAHPIRKNIYALIVDNGQIHVLTVSSESDESEELEPEG